jgi:hypothetical protein
LLNGTRRCSENRRHRRCEASDEFSSQAHRFLIGGESLYKVPAATKQLLALVSYRGVEPSARLVEPIGAAGKLRFANADRVDPDTKVTREICRVHAISGKPQGDRVGSSGLLEIGLALALISCGGGGDSSTSSGSSGSSTTASAPTVTTQPASQTIAVGSAATFSVTASGSDTLTYQWYKDSSAISGASASTYAISSVATSDADSYYVTISNSGGTTTGSTATLTVSSTSTASCDTTYVDSVLSAITTLESALGTSLASSTLCSSSSYTTSQLNVYKISQWALSIHFSMAGRRTNSLPV